MTTLTNSFEGGSNGTTITAANSGSGSGNAFNTVTGPPTSGTLAFDSTRAAHGSLSCKVATSTSSGQDLVRWDSSMGTQAQVWFRAYLYFTANPGANTRIIQAATPGGSLAAVIVVSTGGVLSGLDKNGTSQVTSGATTIPLNAWWRLEGFFTGSATAGQIEMKMFTSGIDNTSPDHTFTSGSALNTNGSMGIYQYGVCSALASVSAYWQDDLGLSSTAYIGPAVTSAASTSGLLPVLFP